ncbi:MAG: MipA/OmpV family protein [bacterium]
MRLFVKKIVLITINVLILVNYSLAQSAGQFENALWELKLFSAVAAFPEYRGSDEYSVYGLPFPYFIYRGECFQSDEEGLKGVFLESKFHEIFISFSGNPPVTSDSSVKRGMPNLDAILEMGPVFKWYFNSIDAHDPIYFEIDIRSASSLNFDSGLNTRYQGQHGDVSVNWNINNPRQLEGLEIYLHAGLDFSDSLYNQYFYDVEEKYVLPDREYYKSDGGYAGFFLSVAMEKVLSPSFTIAAYLGWDNLTGAVFEDSPLVTDTNYIVAGCAVIWKIMESKTKAAHRIGR